MALHIFMNNINKSYITKPLNQSTLYVYTKLNLSTKTKNHYEVLGISPESTYNEIKSAYYDLSLKYHPDKNKSESARQKFHEISDAYDVLSKYESRRRYNKTLSSSRQTVPFKKQAKAESPRYAYRRDKIYNYDEWLKQHYSITFNEGTRVRGAQLEEEAEAPTTNIVYRVRGYILVIMITMPGFALLQWIRDCYF